MTLFTLSSIRVRLLLLVFLTVFPALGLTYYNVIEHRRQAADQAQEETLRLVRLASSNYEQLANDTHQILDIIAQLPAVSSGDSALCKPLFVDVLKRHPLYMNIGLIKSNGDLLCSAIPVNNPVNMAEQPYFLNTLQTRDFTVGDYQFKNITGKSVLTFSHPVLSNNGQVLSVLFAELDLTWLSQLAAKIELPPGATLTVIDRNGTILSRYPDADKWIGKSMPEVPIVKAVLSRQGEGSVEGTGLDGTPRLYAFRPLKAAAGGGEIYIYTGIPTEVVFADADRMLVRNLTGVGLLTLLMLAIAWLGSNKLLLRQMNSLLVATKSLTSGDLSTRTGPPYDTGELGQLSRAFDHMAKALEKSIRQNELLLNSAGEGIFGLELNGETTFVNPAAARLLGYEVEELIAQNSHAVWHHSKTDGSPYPEEECPIYAAHNDGLVHHVAEEVFWRKDGTCFPVEYVSTPIIEQGDIAGAVVIFKDITERKRAEGLSRREAARTEMMSELSQALVEASLDHQAVLSIVVRRAGELIGDACVIDLLSEDGRWLNPAAFYHPNPETTAFMSGFMTPIPHPGEGQASRVVQTGQPLLIPVVTPEQASALINSECSPYLESIGIHSILIVPLRVQGRVIGTLSLSRDTPGSPYTPDDQIFLQDLADRTALAIANARLFSNNVQQLEGLSALCNSTQKLVQNLDMQKLAEDVVSTCVEVFGASLAWLGRAEESGSIRPLVYFPPENEYLRNITVRWDDSPTGKGSAGRAIHNGSPVVITDIATDPNFAPWREAALEQGFSCVAAFPLISRDRPFGNLTLYIDKPGFFTPERVEFFQTYANQAAAALENARLFGEAERRLKHVQALRNIDMAITASLDLRVTFNVVLDQVTGELGIHAANILLLNPYTQSLEYAAGRGFRFKGIERSRLRLDEEYTGRAVFERRIISIPNLPEVGAAFLRAPLLADENFIAYFGVPLIAKGQVKGLLEIFHRAPLDPDQEWLEFLETLAGQAAIAIDNAALFDGMQRSNIELTQAYDATIEGWSRALDMRDKETEGHSQRVTEMTVLLARALGIDEAELVHVRRGALLHDIGKLGVPDHILLKPGPLTNEEWEFMRKHPDYAYAMLSPITYLSPALDIPYCHHEKWDGTGYPRGLKGHQIPLAARIFSIVDVWDALRSERPYRPAWPEEKVRQYIREQTRKYFDPDIVELALKIKW